MIDIKKLKPKELAGPEIFSQIKELVHEHSFGGMMAETLDDLRVLERLLAENKNLEQLNPALYKNYQELVIKLKLICLPLLPDGEILGILKNNFLSFFKFDIDVSNKLELYFILHNDDYQEHRMRKAVANALAANEEKLGEGLIIRQKGQAPEQPLIMNWIRDFLQSTPAGQPPGTLDEMNYFNTSPNVKKLNGQDREKLIKIIQLYNYLLYPAAAGAAVKETGHRIAKDTFFSAQQASQYSKPVNPLESLRKKYQIYRANRWKALKIEDELTVQTQGEFNQVKKELALAVRQNNKDRAIASLIILARQKTLADSLKNNPAWQESLEDYLVIKFAKKNKPEEIQAAVSDIKINPDSPAVISEFLQYILMEKLKMSENDSALVGTEIGQLLGNPYQSIAYGNQETGSFEWTKNEIINGKLVSEV